MRWLTIWKRCRARWLVLLVLAVLPLLMVRLGFWQLSRADEKQDNIARFEAVQRLPALNCGADFADPDQSQADRRVRLSGEYEMPWDAQADAVARSADLLLVDNRTHEGRVGYQALAPFRCANGHRVLVDRGWIALPEQSRDVMPLLHAPKGPVTLNGVISPWRERSAAPVDGWVSPAEELQERVYRAPARIGWYSQDTVAQLLKWPEVTLVVLDPGEPGSFVASGSAERFDTAKHRGYALQWFAMAVGVTLWCCYAFFRPLPGNEREEKLAND